MRNKVLESRRNFLRTSVAGAAGMALVGPMANKAKAANINCTKINMSTTPINTDIDNLRVAWITDSAMLKANPTWGGFDTFNNPTNTNGVEYAVVKSNMDKLACALANKVNTSLVGDPSAAWDTILKIPSTKTWATATAALKVNCFAGDFPSVPIVSKICEVLIAKGMPAANIRLLDGGCSGVYNKAVYAGAGKPIPAGVTFDQNNSGDIMVFANPAANIRCAAGVGLVDILVNIAVNKGHDRFDEFSGVTMCQKNHFWTTDVGHAGAANAFTYLARNNSSSHLIGNVPTTYPARQQLCIVDSLWLGNAGDWAGGINNANHADSIVMCTFAGAADYVATMKIRSTKIAASTWNQPIVDRFITEYGYAAAAKTTVMTAVTGAGAGLFDAKPIILPTTQATLPRENQNLTREGYIQFSVSGNGITSMNTNLHFAKGETVRSAEIYNVMGRKVRTLAASGQSRITWDGKTESGRLAKAGNYIVKMIGSRTTASESFVLAR
jgi:hypothetical protein